MKNFFRKIYWKSCFFLKLLFLSPGIIVHEFSHAFFCYISGTKIHKIKFFQFCEISGYVKHEEAKNLFAAFFISFGPIFINTFFSYFLFSKIFLEGFLLKINFSNFLLFYLAFSVGLSAIPSDQDGEVFGNFIKKKFAKNFLFFLLYIFYPFVWILNLANFLKKYYIDYFFVFTIFYFAKFF